VGTKSRCKVRPLHAPNIGRRGHRQTQVSADAISIAKEVVIFDTARRAPALAFFYIFALGAGVAHQLQLPVLAAAYAIRLVAKVALSGHPVIASDLMGLPIEAAPARPTARGGLRERVPVAKQQSTFVERAGICAKLLTRITRFA
jgi:hypothetical protein